MSDAPETGSSSGARVGREPVLLDERLAGIGEVRIQRGDAVAEGEVELVEAPRLVPARIDAGPDRSLVQFVPNPPIDAGRLILLVQKDGRVRFAGPDRIRIERAAPSLAERVALLRDFLKQL